MALLHRRAGESLVDGTVRKETQWREGAGYGTLLLVRELAGEHDTNANRERFRWGNYKTAGRKSAGCH